MKKKICIAGDSWGVGVWDIQETFTHNHPINHRGFAEFLEKDHEVTNTSTAGASNDLAHWWVEDVLFDKSKKFDIMFWFFTDPLRDFRPDYNIFRSKDITFEGILKAQHEQTIKAYEKFNKIGIPVYCMGGTVRLNIELMKNYSNLIPFIPCITEYLEPNYEHPDVWQSDWMHQVGKQFSLECLDKFLINKRKQDNLLNYKEHFWPDGGHPNKLGHYKIYQKACQELKL